MVYNMYLYKLVGTMFVMMVILMCLTLLLGFLLLFVLPPLWGVLQVLSLILGVLAFGLDRMSSFLAKRSVLCGSCPLCRGSLAHLNPSRLICEICKKEWMSDGRIPNLSIFRKP